VRLATHLRNWDLAVPGSPSSSTLMSPLRRCFPVYVLSCPPNMASASARLMSSCPKMDGAMDSKI